MAIELADLREILLSLKGVEEYVGGNLLILGSAEVHVSADEYKALVAETGFLSHYFPDKLTPFSLGEALGFKLTETLDINGEATITHDLMLPIPASLCDKYHMIIDAGVLFWCFNPGLALNNIYSMLRLNGIAVHITAVSGFYGRGYYNIHPRLFDDFYKANNCTFILANYRAKLIRPNLLKRIMNRLMRLIGLPGGGYFNGRTISFGAIYFAQTKFRCYSFLSYAPESTPEYIPNDSLGCFAFKKTGPMNEVTHPVLLTHEGRMISSQ